MLFLLPSVISKSNNDFLKKHDNKQIALFKFVYALFLHVIAIKKSKYECGDIVEMTYTELPDVQPVKIIINKDKQDLMFC